MSKIEKASLTRQGEIERCLIKKFRKPIWTKCTRAIKDYELIQDGDSVAVCISGGKDSMLLAKLLQELSRHGKVRFDLKFLAMDPGYNSENRALIEANAKLLGIPLTVFETQIFNTVADIKDSPCYLCARMRRGHLYSNAKKLGCNKIALGHHFDDVIETTLMSMLYSGQMRSMMPKLHSTNFPGMELIRPMYLIREEDIIAWRDYHKLRFLRCACRFTEAVENEDDEMTSKRRETKELIRQLRKKSDVIDKNIFRSTHNVHLDTMPGYKKDYIKHSFLEDYDLQVQTINTELKKERVTDD